MFHLFERFGLELEYMIVDRETLEIVPICDKVIELVCGKIQNEVQRGDISWSNELVLHVIELKTALPVKKIDDLADKFFNNIKEINKLLEKFNAMLLPGPMHPFMHPVEDMHLWPHEYSPIYSAFDKIFSCKGHGWSNLQSMHINLPFFDDSEFAKLHTAIRLLLPIISALSAGSPIADSAISGFHDYRMEVYRTNSKKIPQITGGVIPDVVLSKVEYEEKILKVIYDALKPYDPEGVLQEEWVNSRGAIARFERNSIEIRTIDVQECASADMAIAAAVIGVVRLLTNEVLCSFEAQQDMATDSLALLFREVINLGEQTVIHDTRFLHLMGLETDECTARELWKYLIGRIDSEIPGYLDQYRISLNHILEHGTLATRILDEIGQDISHVSIVNVYKKLAECLVNNTML